MARPAESEWETVFGFSDPTPGDAEMLGRLAGRYRSVADDAGDAYPMIKGLEGGQIGEGKSMDKLREKLGDLAGQVEKLHSSYDKAASALSTYADQLEEHQRKADRALDDGREAKERLERATDAAAAAGSVIGDLDAAAPIPPDDEAARRSAREAMDAARSDQSAAQDDADTAQAELDAARMLAEDARELRETDALTAANALDEADDEAVPGKTWWEKFGDIVKNVFTFVSAALGIIAMIIPGLQGLGLILTVGSIVFGAASLGMTIAESVETGEWDVLDIVLGSLGLLLGGAGLVAISRLGGLANTFRTVGANINTVKTNVMTAGAVIKTSVQFKNLEGLVANMTRNLVTNVLTKLPNITLGAPAMSSLPTISNIWTKTVDWITQSSNLAGLAGFAWSVNGVVPHGSDGTTVRDDSYLPGTT